MVADGDVVLYSVDGVTEFSVVLVGFPDAVRLHPSLKVSYIVDSKSVDDMGCMNKDYAFDPTKQSFLQAKQAFLRGESQTVEELIASAG